jgi:hypothetical protein
VATDIDILRRAYEVENDSRNRLPQAMRGGWESYTVGATRKEINHLLDDGLIRISVKSPRDHLIKYKLTEKGLSIVKATYAEVEEKKIPATDIMDALSLVVGFGDIKEAIAHAVADNRRTNFLLEGPPACAKSIMLEGVRSIAPSAYMVFGSRTSAAGLSDVLFNHQPGVLLLDEADKMHHEVYSVLLGLMERGEILETKNQRTRGIILNTMVIAACNSSVKMPREFLSRFALHIHFPEYTRQEFIDVCVGMLGRAENCPQDIAQMLGEKVYDYQIGDVRKARGAWSMMRKPIQSEVDRVIQLMVKYGADQIDRQSKPKTVPQRRLI